MFDDECCNGDCEYCKPGLEDQAGHDVRVPVAAPQCQAPTGLKAYKADPDPTKPYPNPEREAAEQQQRALIEYRRGLRDFLHGTTTEE